MFYFHFYYYYYLFYFTLFLFCLNTFFNWGILHSIKDDKKTKQNNKNKKTYITVGCRCGEERPKIMTCYSPMLSCLQESDSFLSLPLC